MLVIDSNIPNAAKKWVFNWKPWGVQICYKKQGGKTKFIRIILKNINYGKAYMIEWDLCFGKEKKCKNKKQ